MKIGKFSSKNWQIFFEEVVKNFWKIARKIDKFSGKIYDFFKENMWHSVSKGPIWSFLETEILRKIGEMVKKTKKIIFHIFWHIEASETLLCWQNTEKATPRLYLCTILRGTKVPIWSISVTSCTVSVKQRKNKLPSPPKMWHTSYGFTRSACSKAGMDAFWSAFAARAFVAYNSKCDCTPK